MPENRGYYAKYTVIEKASGKTIDERTFTLKIDSDPFAPAALQAYRDAAQDAGGYDKLVAALDEILAGQRSDR